LALTHKSILSDEFRSSGVEVFSYNRKLPIDLGLVFKLKRIVNEKSVEVIHTHQAVDGLHAYLTKKITGVKIVMSFHGHIPSLKDDSTLKFLIPRMDANIAVSNSFLKRLSEEIKFNTSRNFHVIYNGIDIRKFYPTDKKFRRELNLKDTDVLLGMVGNFNNDVRDQLTICKTLPSILRKYSNAHFAFVGGKSENYPRFFDDCFNFCKENHLLDRVHFVGARIDINDVLNSLNIFVYSSNHDTFGIAVIEAMISGLPIIINDLPALLEVTNNGKYASVFKSKSPEDLENKIITIIKNESERNKQADSGKEWAFKQFNIVNHIENLKKLYLSL